MLCAARVGETKIGKFTIKCNIYKVQLAQATIEMFLSMNILYGFSMV